MTLLNEVECNVKHDEFFDQPDTCTPSKIAPEEFWTLTRCSEFDMIIRPMKHGAERPTPDLDEEVFIHYEVSSDGHVYFTEQELIDFDLFNLPLEERPTSMYQTHFYSHLASDYEWREDIMKRAQKRKEHAVRQLAEARFFGELNDCYQGTSHDWEGARNALEYDPIARWLPREVLYRQDGIKLIARIKDQAPGDYRALVKGKMPRVRNSFCLEDLEELVDQQLAASAGSTP